MIAALGLASSACDDTPKKRQTPPDASLTGPVTAVGAASVFPANGAAYYAERCASCHGVEGKGDGTAAATLSPRPRNFADADWQKGVTDADLEKVIVGGGPAVGKSPTMPPNPELATRRELLAEVVAEVRAKGGSRKTSAPVPQPR